VEFQHLREAYGTGIHARKNTYLQIGPYLRQVDMLAAVCTHQSELTLYAQNRQPLLATLRIAKPLQYIQ